MKAGDLPPYGGETRFAGGSGGRKRGKGVLYFLCIPFVSMWTRKGKHNRRVRNQNMYGGSRVTWVVVWGPLGLVCFLLSAVAFPCAPL